MSPLATRVGTFGLPPDAPAALALAFALIALLDGAGAVRRVFLAPRRLTLGTVAIAAALLSWGYVLYYLRGGPRIIDATSYWLEARSLSQGHVTWPALDPSASSRGRFLLESAAAGGSRIGVIFPPGWPAALALGFLAGEPMLVGPVVAALLVVATYALGKKASGREDVARAAALFSLTSAALRYHTADTMSHGLAALLFASAIALALHAEGAVAPRARSAAALLSGFCAAWLLATRPTTALALAPVLAAVGMRLDRPRRLAVVAGALLPAAAFVAEQRAVTGAWLTSSQLAYYALSDGPPGCFRWGFGRGIGCLHEHGDFVRDRLAGGFRWGAAAMTTLRRLKLHLADVANFEPLALVVPLGALAPRAPDRVRLLGVGALLVVLAYAPFYFDGNYPGGGGRLLADALPLEHVLLAAGLLALSERARARWPLVTPPRVVAVALALALAAFACHGAFDHLALADRDGGRPYFEPEAMEKAKVDRGLLFTMTDHAQALALDPGARDPSRGLVVARELGDDRDRLLWERLGRPQAHRYQFDEHGGPFVNVWSPGPERSTWRFEAESEWPPKSQRGGFFEPSPASGTCAWGGAVLAVHVAEGEQFAGSIALPVPRAGRWTVAPRFASSGRFWLRMTLAGAPDLAPYAIWWKEDAGSSFGCGALEPRDVYLPEGEVEVRVDVAGPGFALDAFELSPAPAFDRPARARPEMR